MYRNDRGIFLDGHIRGNVLKKNLNGNDVPVAVDPGLVLKLRSDLPISDATYYDAFNRQGDKGPPSMVSTYRYGPHNVTMDINLERPNPGGDPNIEKPMTVEVILSLIYLHEHCEVVGIKVESEYYTVGVLAVLYHCTCVYTIATHGIKA